MLKTLYVKRFKIFENEWGIQHGVAGTALLRATRGRHPLPIHWEWVSAGKPVEGPELHWLLRRYPLCEFQDDESLHRRSSRRARGASA